MNLSQRTRQFIAKKKVKDAETVLKEIKIKEVERIARENIVNSIRKEADERIRIAREEAEEHVRIAREAEERARITREEAEEYVRFARETEELARITRERAEEHARIAKESEDRDWNDWTTRDKEDYKRQTELEEYVREATNNLNKAEENMKEVNSDIIKEFQELFRTLPQKIDTINKDIQTSEKTKYFADAQYISKERIGFTCPLGCIDKTDYTGLDLKILGRPPHEGHTFDNYDGILTERTIIINDKHNLKCPHLNENDELSIYVPAKGLRRHTDPKRPRLF